MNRVQVNFRKACSTTDLTPLAKRAFNFIFEIPASLNGWC